MAKSRGFTVEQKTEMRVAYEQGNILKVIAEKWQVSVPTMSKYIRSVGGVLRNAGTPKKVQNVVFTNGAGSAPTPEPMFNMPILVPNPNGITRDMVPQPEIATPQAPVNRRILPFE
jgi:hypothetical protein